MAKEKKKKRKRVYLNVDDQPVYDADAAFKPYDPFGYEWDAAGQIDGCGLTLKQRLFIDAYVGPANGSAAKAAVLAGYAGNGFAAQRTGWKILNLPLVQEGIAHALAKHRMTAEWVKLTLFELANCNLNNFFDINEKGDLERINFGKARALGAMRQLKEYDPEKGKIKVHDSIAALTILAKFYNLIREAAPETADDLPLEESPLRGRVNLPEGLN